MAIEQEIERLSISLLNAIQVNIQNLKVICIYLQKGIRVQEVGVRMFERTTGESSINLMKAVGYMIDVSLSILIAALLEKGE